MSPGWIVVTDTVVCYLAREYRRLEAEQRRRTEKTPCSQCRDRFVKALVGLDRLPSDLRDECRWDTNPATRQLVE